jgi:hypothetical protein
VTTLVGRSEHDGFQETPSLEAVLFAPVSSAAEISAERLRVLCAPISKVVKVGSGRNVQATRNPKIFTFKRASI